VRIINVASSEYVACICFVRGASPLNVHHRLPRHLLVASPQFYFIWCACLVSWWYLDMLIVYFVVHLKVMLIFQKFSLWCKPLYICLPFQSAEQSVKAHVQLVNRVEVVVTDITYSRIRGDMSSRRSRKRHCNEQECSEVSRICLYWTLEVHLSSSRYYGILQYSL